MLDKAGHLQPGQQACNDVSDDPESCSNWLMSAERPYPWPVAPRALQESVLTATVSQARGRRNMWQHSEEDYSQVLLFIVD